MRDCLINSIVCRRCRAALVVLMASLCSTGRADEVTFVRDVRPLLQTRCGKCHGAETHERDINFSAIGDDKAAARQRKLWRKSVAQIEAGEMPPADETPLTNEERERLLGWMKRTIETSRISSDGKAGARI